MYSTRAVIHCTCGHASVALMIFILHFITKCCENEAKSHICYFFASLAWKEPLMECMGCSQRAKMCGKARQGCLVATVFRVHWLVDVQAFEEKQVTGPDWDTPPPLIPKSEARVSGSTPFPLEARSECICWDSSGFPFSVSPKGSNGCHTVLMKTGKCWHSRGTQHSCSFTSVTTLAQKCNSYNQLCCMACAGTPKAAVIFL